MSQEAGAAMHRPTLVLQKVRTILACFTLDQPRLTLREITKLTELPTSTCQRLVQNLVHEGFLDRDGDAYRIGIGLVRWAAPGAYGLDLVELVRPVLDELREQVDESAYLQVRHGPHRVIVALSEVHHQVVRRFMVGMVMPLHVGSAGKIFLTYDPSAWRAAINQGLRTVGDNRAVDVDVLERELAEIRTHGYAATFEERDAGAGSLSAPVFGMDGAIVGAVGIGAPIQRFSPERVETLIPAVLAAGRRASQSMGFRAHA